MIPYLSLKWKYKASWTSTVVQNIDLGVESGFEVMCGNIYPLGFLDKLINFFKLQLSFVEVW
jgi:hypothetical protein